MFPRFELCRALKTLSLLAFVSLAGCRSAPHEETIELRTYDVPKGTANSLVTTFKDVMWMGENKNIGRAVVTPDGRLAVLATPGVQAGVEALVQEVERHPPTPEQQSVTLHYFLVIGKPAASPQGYPPGTGEIKAGLDEIVRTQGPQTFTLARSVELTSMNDEEGRLDNTEGKLEIRQKAVQSTEAVYTRISIRWKEDKIETRVQLGPERIVVLGATGQHGGDAQDGSTLYYVVRVAPRPDGKNR